MYHSLATRADLELGDTVTDGDKFRETPDKTVLLDGTDTGLESLHVGLIIPRLDVEGDNRLLNAKSAFMHETRQMIGVYADLGGGSNLLGLLLLVGGDTLGLNALGLSILLLIVGSEEVDLVVVIPSGGGSSGGGLGGGGSGDEVLDLLGAVAGEAGELGRV